jgi:hypothetical protein
VLSSSSEMGGSGITMVNIVCCVEFDVEAMEEVCEVNN